MRRRPVSSLIYPAPTAANYPALKHFFPMRETSGTTITDTVGGCVWQPADEGYALAFNPVIGAVSTKRGDGSPMRATDPPIPLASGTWTSVYDSGCYLAICVGKMEDQSFSGSFGSRFALGDINAGLAYPAPAGIGMVGCSYFHVAAGASLLAQGGFCVSKEDNDADGCTYGENVAIGDDIILCFAYDRTEQSRYIMLDALNGSLIAEAKIWRTATTGATQLATGMVPPLVSGVDPVTGLASPGIGYYIPNPCMRFAGMAVYGYALLTFADALPATWLGDVCWMAREWITGNRVMPSAWLGVS
jgi:hypothetical protein